jgi:polyferredoxin
VKAIERHFHRQNTIAWIVTIVAIAIPFIQIDGKHLLLFNFYAFRFEFLFHAWEVSTGYLVVIFVLFATGVILLFNFTYSRYFCGQICPKTLLKRFFRDQIEAKIFKIARLTNRQREEKVEKSFFKTAMAYLTLLLLSTLSAWAFFFYLIPAPVLIDMTTSGFSGYPVVGYTWASITVYLFAEALYFKEFFCSYICPYQLVSSVTVSDDRCYYAFDDPQHCTRCGACVRICPVPNLDIRDGFDTRCISCGDCAEICEDAMHQEGRDKSLITYRSSSGKLKAHPYFSFSKPAISIVLALTAIITIGLMIGYLVSPENLDQCHFINADLYR